MADYPQEVLPNLSVLYSLQLIHKAELEKSGNLAHSLVTTSQPRDIS